MEEFSKGHSKEYESAVARDSVATNRESETYIQKKE